MRGLGGIVLAAGASERAGCAKALARLDGETLVARTVRTLREGGAGEIVVVVGAPHADAIVAVLEGVTIAENPAPARGMMSSLQLALALADGARWDAAIISLVDHPRVLASSVAELVRAMERTGAPVVRPRAGERSGHPYLVARAAFPSLLAASHDETARSILASIAGARDVEIDDRGMFEDLDTAADLAAAGIAPGPA